VPLLVSIKGENYKESRLLQTRPRPSKRRKNAAKEAEVEEVGYFSLRRNSILSLRLTNLESRKYNGRDTLLWLTVRLVLCSL
jgi:hypothetical protein